MICQALKIFQACCLNPLFAHEHLEDGEEQRCHSPRTHSRKSSRFPATESWTLNFIKCQEIWRFKVGQPGWDKASRFWPRCIIFARRCRLPASVYFMQHLCVHEILKRSKRILKAYGDLVFPMRPWPCPKDLCAAAVKNALCSAAVRSFLTQLAAAYSSLLLPHTAANLGLEYPAKLFFQLLKYYSEHLVVQF